MFRKPRTRPRTDVVDTVRSQTTQAAQLSDIAAQRLLADPRTNPATRGHADTLRNSQQRAELEAEHTRRLRRIRVDDARAAHAERAMEALRSAREAHSPARAVIALTAGRRRYGTVALAASLALSVGSALGAEALAQSWEAPWGVGYLAEIGMTGLATTVILYTGHLTGNSGSAVRLEGWQRGALLALMIAPLLASIVVSSLGSGPVGGACSIGAAAFALLAYLVADRSSAAITARAGEVDATDEQELAATIDRGLFDPVDTAAEPDAPVPASRSEAGWVSDADIAAWLGQDPPPDGGATTPGPAPAGPAAPAGAARTPPGDVPLAQIDTDQPSDPTANEDGGEATERVIAATEARAAVREANTQRVADYLTDHPHASIRDTARATGLSESTVKRAKRALRDETA